MIGVVVMAVGAREVLIKFLIRTCRRPVAYTLIGGPVAGFTVCCQAWLRFTCKEIKLELDRLESKISISRPQLIFEAWGPGSDRMQSLAQNLASHCFF